MDRHFVKVLSDVHCDWEGLPPDYRVYVDNELFAERTYIWTDCYLEEILQIEAPVGEYTIRYELVQPCLARLRIENQRVDYGPGTVANNKLRIHHESA
jgi:hypothetical protein